MASNTAIFIKKSGVTGNTPANLSYGEIAINYADGKLYYKDDLNTIRFINNQDSFSTINSGGTLLLASSPTDILNLVPGANVTFATNTTTKTITIDSIGGGGGGGGSANTIETYHFPIGDYGFVTQSIYDVFGGIIGPVFDMREDPKNVGLIPIDLGYVS